MKYLASFFRGRLKYRLVITTIVHAQKSLPYSFTKMLSHTWFRWLFGLCLVFLLGLTITKAGKESQNNELI